MFGLGKVIGKARLRSIRAGLQFPVVLMHHLLKKENFLANVLVAERPVYLLAVMEFWAAEVLELTGNGARDNKKTRAILRLWQLAIRNDEVLNELLS